MRRLGLLAVVVAACTPASGRSEGAANEVDAATTSDAGLDAARPPPVVVHLAMTIVDGGSGSLEAIVSGSEQRIALTRVTPPFACETTWVHARDPEEDVIESGDGGPHDRLRIECGSEKTGHASIQLGEQDVALYGTSCGGAPGLCARVPLLGASATIDPTIAEARGDCADDAPPRRIDVFFARVRPPGEDWNVEMRIPALGVHADLLGAERGVYCAGFAARLHSFEIECMSTVNEVIQFRVRDRAIHALFSSHGTEDELEYPLAAIELPCGAVVHWQKFEAWEPAPGPPSGGVRVPFDTCNCAVAVARCEHRCAETWMSDDGEIPWAGRECAMRCGESVVCPCTGRKRSH